MGIQGRHLQLLLDFAAYRFLSVETLRGLLPDPNIDLCAEDCHIPFPTYQRILQFMLKEETASDLGLRYGMYLNLQALGLVHSISLEATSIEQAILMLAEYLQAYFPFLRLRSSILDGEIQLELSTDIEEEKLRRFMLDSTYCFMYRELKAMGVEKISMEVPYSDASAFLRSLAQEVESGAYHRFSFDLAVNHTINRRSMQLIDVLLPQFLLLLEKEKGVTFPAMVKRMLLQMSTPILPSLSQVSAQFAMSDRNFQRKLRSHGQSFRSITNAVKQELAHYLQEGGKMKVKDIAYAFGYSEPSAYLHARKNWNNQ